MDAIQGAENSFEKFICDKASMKNLPIGATFELTPVCNMNCRMCYVRMDAGEVKKRGDLMPVSFWLNLAEQLKEAGTLYILLTGGEPLLYPEFQKLYIALHKMGFIININTNGTLITEEIAELFHAYQPRRLSITLYGKDDETYGRLCQNPKGFSQLMHGLGLLARYNIPVRLTCSLTPYNYEDRFEMRRIAGELGLHMEMTAYMFPQLRKKSAGIACEENRLQPEQAAEIGFWVDTYGMTEEVRAIYVREKLKLIDGFDSSQKALPGGFWCRAANASFWTNWNGTISPCGMLAEPWYDLKDKPFMDVWTQMVKDNKQVLLSEECLHCNKQSICLHCGSAEMTENGIYGQKIDYLCRYCDRYYEILKQELHKEA